MSAWTLLVACETLNDVAQGVLDNGGRNFKINGGHSGARKRAGAAADAAFAAAFPGKEAELKAAKAAKGLHWSKGEGKKWLEAIPPPPEDNKFIPFPRTSASLIVALRNSQGTGYRIMMNRRADNLR